MPRSSTSRASNREKPLQPNSQLGIASLIFSLVPIPVFTLLTFFTLSIADQYRDSNVLPTTEQVREMLAPMLIGIGVGIVSVLLAFIFGLISLVQEKKSPFGIAGLGVTALWTLLLIGSFIWGA